MYAPVIVDFLNHRRLNTVLFTRATLC